MKSAVKIGLLAAAAIALVVGALLLAGVSPAVAGKSLWQSNFGSANAVAGLLRETTPLLILGAAVFIALKAGLFNIGAEGQFLAGAIVAAAVALKVPGPLGLVLAVLAAVAMGALWALPAAWIKAYRHGHEVITTIMMNQIAVYVTTVLVAGPLKDKAQESTTTAMISDSSRLPSLTLGGVSVNVAIVISVVLVVLGARWLARSVSGFELRAAGANPVAARFAGVATAKVQFSAMLASGALSGFAGFVQVAAYEGRFYAGFSPGYGFDALGVALLGGGGMLGVIPAALGFGMLNKGSTALTIEGVPKGITSVVLGLLIVVFAAVRYRRAVRSG